MTPVPEIRGRYMYSLNSGVLYNRTSTCRENDFKLHVILMKIFNGLEMVDAVRFLLYAIRVP